LKDPAQGLREQIRVARSGGVVSAIACFCHSGGLPHYHGRYPLSGNHRIDELDLKLDRIWRRSIRPQLLDADHSIQNLDLAWQFKAAGLQDVQVDGHLSLVSPGDARLQVEEGAAYALARQRKVLDSLIRTRQDHGDALAAGGFSRAEFDELIALKQARYDYLQADPARVREVMEVFAEPFLIARGTKP